METRHRPAARVLCLDASWRVLMIQWRDPHSGRLLWEPPGGGIEPGETPLTAARRELAEETGLDGGAVAGRSHTIERDVIWNGARFVGPEHFFVAGFWVERPPVTTEGQLPDERVDFVSHAWIAWPDFPTLTQPVLPRALRDVLVGLAPDGPWGHQDR
ncbi:NUDIX domain-containing protein [Spiractinospora alimapuensis]|uniref:NUDIX domain-containing protein n=1 Tax=Spiractinospora alimapuensis TaxID=2820884 RepID=UPI0022AA964D|nr:NUDIX domain-containing protein [Spiractinospora alimapuensis]QVQ54147.1 NUDIX domain-containing protein [Spiractinospora alimapuensis]